MKVQIVFQKSESGKVSVKYGVLKSAGSFSDTDRLTVEVAEEKLHEGSRSTIITAGIFSFFLRDVNSAYPVFVPDIGAAALPEGDHRSYDEVCQTIQALIDQSLQFDDMETVRLMKKMVPEYISQQSDYEVLDKELAEEREELEKKEKEQEK